MVRLAGQENPPEAIHLTGTFMYDLTLKPGESVFGRCTHCRKLNLLFGNPTKEIELTIPFKTSDVQLDAYCHECREFFIWTPATALVENPHSN